LIVDTNEQFRKNAKLRREYRIILIPLALMYGGFPLEATPYRPNVPLDYSILAPWLAFGFVLGEFSERLRLQNGYLLAQIFSARR
jgi:hypothetical protein